MLGLKRGTVRLISDKHNEWAKLFQEEKDAIESLLGGRMLGIEHVGSTAIPGVPAKPILDIVVAIPSLKDWESIAQDLRALGYHPAEHQDFPDRRLLVKGLEESRTHHLNLTEKGSLFIWSNHILFRDYLRSNEQARQEYVLLKQKLARTYRNNRGAYTEAKADFIRRIIDQAKQSIRE